MVVGFSSIQITAVLGKETKVEEAVGNFHAARNQSFPDLQYTTLILFSLEEITAGLRDMTNISEADRYETIRADFFPYQQCFLIVALGLIQVASVIRELTEARKVPRQGLGSRSQFLAYFQSKKSLFLSKS